MTKRWIWSDFPLSYMYGKPLLFKRPNSFEFWIENLCHPKKMIFFFEQLAAVVWTAEHFSEQITPTIWMAFLMIFLSIIPIAWRKASQQFLAVWTSTHWCTVSSCERSDKEIKSELGITVGPSFLYSRMNNATVSTWHERSTWPASENFGWSSQHSGQTLSVDRPLF